MAKNRIEVFDTEYQRLPTRAWVRSDSSGGETHVIPLQAIRDKVVAFSCVEDTLRVFVDPDAGGTIDISEIKIGARCYKIRWADTARLREAAVKHKLIDEESERTPSAMVVHEDETILLVDTLRLMPLRALETLFHELTHILEDVCGLGAEGGWPEGLIDALGIQQVNILVQSGFIDKNRISLAGVPLAKQRVDDG
jgi:hypothetical protein